MAVTVAGMMLALGIAGLTCFLAPAYARPPVYTNGEAPPPTHRLDRTYLEDGDPLATLIGYTLDEETVRPGSVAEVKLHWQVLRETDANYVLFAQLFGREAAKVGQRDTYPGLGHYPTSFWQPGEVIVDEIPILVASDALAPTRLRLDVGLYQREGHRLAIVDDAGNAVSSATIGWLRLVPQEAPPPPAVTASYDLGDRIALTGYGWEQGTTSLHLTLNWVCLRPINRDYTVFVHLLDDEGSLVAQDDGPPLDGDYPTSYWTPQQEIVDSRVLDIEGLPSGTYYLRVGMYLLKSMERLPVTGADGARLADDVIPLLELNLP
jgi:hypothetical protein